MFAPGFIAKVTSVIDPGLRAHMAALELAEMAPTAAAGAIAEAIRQSVGARDARAQAALLAVVVALGTNKFSYLTLAALYTACRADGQEAVARMLLQLTSERGASGGPDVAPERALRPNDRPLSLGQRKSLARTKNRDVLALLARDPNPDVVAILLGNPQLTERDVVRIAAHRPGLPSALRTIARHPRWLAAPHIRVALISNPATDLSLAIRLIATLPRLEIEAVLREGALHPEIVSQAQLVLQLATTPAAIMN